MIIVTIHTLIVLVVSYLIGVYLYLQAIKLYKNKTQIKNPDLFIKSLMFLTINSPMVSGLGGPHGMIILLFPSYVGLPYMYFIDDLGFTGVTLRFGVAFIVLLPVVYLIFKASVPKADVSD